MWFATYEVHPERCGAPESNAGPREQEDVPHARSTGSPEQELYRRPGPDDGDGVGQNDEARIVGWRELSVGRGRLCHLSCGQVLAPTRDLCLAGPGVWYGAAGGRCKGRRCGTGRVAKRRCEPSGERAEMHKVTSRSEYSRSLWEPASTQQSRLRRSCLSSRTSLLCLPNTHLQPTFTSMLRSARALKSAAAHVIPARSAASLVGRPFACVGTHSAPILHVRAFASLQPLKLQSQDQRYTSKKWAAGDVVTYEELKPLTEAPSDVSSAYTRRPPEFRCADNLLLHRRRTFFSSVRAPSSSRVGPGEGECALTSSLLCRRS